MTKQKAFGIQIHGSKLVFIRQELSERPCHTMTFFDCMDIKAEAIFKWCVCLNHKKNMQISLWRELQLCSTSSADNHAVESCHPETGVVRLQLCSFLLQTCRAPCKALRICANHTRLGGFSLLLNFKESALVCVDTDEVVGTWLKKAVPSTVAAFPFGSCPERFYELSAPILQQRGSST